jgi:energy-coupling factor transport system permease protein
MAPILKFIAMLGFIASAYILQDPRFIACLILIQALIAAGCRVFRAYRITLAALAIGALTLTLFQIFTITDGDTAFYLIPFLKFGRITDQGLYASLIMSLRMVASVGSVPLMLSVTSQSQVISLVSGSFRLPPAYTIMLITALRFIPTFGDRMRMVMQAEASRGYRSDSGNIFKKAGMIMRMSLPLLVSCARDVDTLALSLETRGFDPACKTRPKAIVPSPVDYAWLTICLASQAATIAGERFFA